MGDHQQQLAKWIASLRPLDGEAMKDASAHLDRLTKPRGSLGKLEALAVQLAGITGQQRPEVTHKAVVVAAADHGVCAEGVSAYPQEVTAQMVRNFLHGGAAVNVLAQLHRADVICVNAGVVSDLPDHPQLLDFSFRRGTGNIAKEIAMTREEAIKTVVLGVELAGKLVGQGYHVLATGEMGIGNTTASSAILAAACGLSAEEVTGRGTGIDDVTYNKKCSIIDQAVRLHHPDPADPLDLISKVGGLEIGMLCGLILGAALQRVPVVIDGFISSSAALLAGRFHPVARDYMIASHLSREHGHRRMLEEAALTPMLQMDMRLGEGSGAVLAFPLLDSAIHILNNMATFEGANIAGHVPKGIYR